jgi:hypothetical protein
VFWLKRFLRLQAVAFGLLILWLAGTYALEAVSAPNQVYWMWAGLVGASWLIGGNILNHRWKRDEARTKRDGAAQDSTLPPPARQEIDES